MPFYTSTWGPVYYELSGPAAAPVVLFTHGVAMDHQTFASQQPALTSHYRVVTWDMPGHGQSFPLTEPLRYDMVADCLLGILDEIGSQCAVLVGLSLGGHIGQFIAYHHPERVMACVDIGSTALHMGFNKVNRSLLKVYLDLSAFIPSTWFYALFARDKARHSDTRCYLQASAARMGKHRYCTYPGQCSRRAAEVFQPHLNNPCSSPTVNTNNFCWCGIYVVGSRVYPEVAMR